MTVENVITADEKVIPIGSLAKAPFYNADGTLNYWQVQYLGVTYRKTYTWTNGVLTNVSKWVKQ